MAKAGCARGGRQWLFLCALATVTLGSRPASASCATCDQQGECIQVETSGNCSCNIRYTNSGVQICRPVGVCDINDPNSCDGGPVVYSKRTVPVNPAGLRLLERQDPLIAAALWGAVDPLFAGDGTCTGAYLHLGTQEGAIRANGVGYHFRIVVSQAENGRKLYLQGSLTPQTGQSIEFRGTLADSGTSGRIDLLRDSRNLVGPRTLTWAVERNTARE